MNYKFYIYKQNRPASIFDKYDLTQYILIREITQNGQWGLKIERDKEFYTVIRRKFSSEIVVKGTDFDTLIGFEGDTEQYAVVIHRECSGVWSEFWKGYFSYFDFKVDLDRCYLTFEPEVWDEYSPVFDQFPIERNILVAEGPQDIFIDAFLFDVETVTEEVALFPPHANASYVEFGSFPTPPHDSLPSPNKYYLFSVESIWTGGLYYHVHRVFKREWYLSDSNVIIPPGFSVAEGGVVLPDEYLPGIYKWVRPIGGMATTTYSHETNSDGDIYEELELPPDSTPILQGCITLKSVLEYFATFMNLSYTSDFFNDTPCPMGTPSLALTMIQQISNLRNTQESATRGIMKLKDLLIQLRDTFNTFPYIDSNGDFRLEHKKYFEYGLSYTVVAGITIDLGALYPDNVLKLRRYEWSKPSVFRWEKLEIPYSYFTDWVNAEIEYPQLSINGYETTTKTVIWGTDIISMMYNSELPTVGWVLLDVYMTGTIVMYKKVRNTTGALSGIAMQNGRFSAANLLRDLWTWGRLLPTGNVNGTLTTFDSIDRLKKQVELSFPQCCTVIDYNGIFRTPLGDGLLDTAEYESKTGNLKVQLIYE